MKAKLYLPLTLLTLLTLWISCSPDVGETIPTEYARPNLPDVAHDYIGESMDPANGRIIHMGPAENPTTNDGITLGRVLFYDNKLSLNNAISCGSCHKQQFGFADPVNLSTGFAQKLTRRNSMSLSNPWEEGKYFWDGRKNTLEEMVMGPVKDHVEMGFSNMEYLEAKLGHFDYYPSLFQKAFGTPEITEERIAKALAQFLRTLGSTRSRAEVSLIKGEPLLTEQETMGFNIFNSKGRCVSCHALPGMGWGGGEFGPAFSLFENTGLDADVTDPGIMNGMFKVPSMRNVGLTAPYMHDGRFKTLEEVVEFYNSQVRPNPYLSWALQDNGFMEGDVVLGGDSLVFTTEEGGAGNGIKPIRLHLTQSEKDALVAFLRAFTDEEYVKDAAISDPFQ